MKNRIKIFLRYPWTSKMVEESVKQRGRGRFAEIIGISNTVGCVVTRSMVWVETTDRDDYWHGIYSQTYSTHL